MGTRRQVPCSKCGLFVDSRVIYCGSCGTPVSATARAKLPLRHPVVKTQKGSWEPDLLDKILAWFLIVAGVAYPGIAIIGIVVISAMAALAGASIDFDFTWLILLPVAYSILLFIGGIALLRGHGWARILTAILAILAIAPSLWFPIGIIIPGFILLVLFRPRKFRITKADLEDNTEAARRE